MFRERTAIALEWNLKKMEDIYLMNKMQRIEQLQAKIVDEKLGGAILFYSRDIFYYTGAAQPSWLVVLPDQYFLFVKSGYDFALNDSFIDKSRIRRERRLENVHRELFAGIGEKRIGSELDIMPANQYFKYRGIFDGFDFVDISPAILEQRKIKDSFEIEQIKKACGAVHAGHDAILSNPCEGITELELAAAVENAHRLAGHEGHFFFRKPDFFMSRGPFSSGSNLFKFTGLVYSITGVGLSPSIPAGPSMRKIRK